MSTGFAVKGTLQLLQSGAITTGQAEEIVNMWIELTAKKFYSEGVLDGLRRNKKATHEMQIIRDMGM